MMPLRRPRNGQHLNPAWSGGDCSENSLHEIRNEARTERAPESFIIHDLLTLEASRYCALVPFVHL